MLMSSTKAERTAARFSVGSLFILTIMLECKAGVKPDYQNSACNYLVRQLYYRKRPEEYH